VDAEAASGRDQNKVGPTSVRVLSPFASVRWLRQIALRNKTQILVPGSQQSREDQAARHGDGPKWIHRSAPRTAKELHASSKRRDCPVRVRSHAASPHVPTANPNHPAAATALVQRALRRNPRPDSRLSVLPAWLPRRPFSDSFRKNKLARSDTPPIPRR